MGSVGDSLSSGTPPSVGWPNVLNTLYAAPRTTNFAVSGSAATVIQTQFETKVRGRYLYVSVLGGTQDVRGGAAATTVEPTLQAIYDNAIASGMTVVVLTLFPLGGWGSWTAPIQAQLEALNTWILTHCATPGFICVDTYNSALRSGISIAAPYDSGDGLHPNAAGEAVVAALVKAALP